MDVLSSRVIIRPTRFARSRRFYEETLGLGVAREFGSDEHPGVVFFAGGGFLELSGDGADPVEPGAALWLQVRDVAAEHARLLSLGARSRREPRQEPWGLIEAWIEDPDGLRIALVQVPADHPLRRDTR